MIDAPELGLKVAENSREKLIKDTIEATERNIVQTELTLELQKKGLEYLRSL